MREIPWVHETIPLRTPNINCLTTKHDNTHVNGFGLTTGPIPFEKKKENCKKKKKKKKKIENCKKKGKAQKELISPSGYRREPFTKKKNI